MKKIIITLLSVFIILSMFACVPSNNENKGNGDEPTVETNFTVTLYLNGGTISGNRTIVNVIYGRSYNLGIPEKQDSVFTGWYNGDQLIETTGIWNYRENMTLTAQWQDDDAWSPIM